MTNFTKELLGCYAVHVYTFDNICVSQKVFGSLQAGGNGTYNLFDLSLVACAFSLYRS